MYNGIYYLVVMGGVEDAYSGAPSGTTLALKYGCNPGWFYADNADPSKWCQPCPAGTYSETAGSVTCASCPVGTTTLPGVTGALHRYECRVCQEDYCSGHGRCTVIEASINASCVCDAVRIPGRVR